jgi:hypothetical protein
MILNHGYLQKKIQALKILKKKLIIISMKEFIKAGYQLIHQQGN